MRQSTTICLRCSLKIALSKSNLSTYTNPPLPISSDELKKLHVRQKERIAIAVSGGVDSMALSYLCSQMAARDPSLRKQFVALTIDHGFRRDSAQEATEVGKILSRLDLELHILKIDWSSPVEFAEMETLGRARRYELLSRACRDLNISTILTAHHAGDQAETILFRFARGAHSTGGLSGMKSATGIPVRVSGSIGLRLLRPFLEFGKDRLIATCRAGNVPWFEDSTNSDVRFARNGIRAFLAETDDRVKAVGDRLESSERVRDILPLTSPSLIRFAKRMARHQDRLNTKVSEILRTSVRFSRHGYCSLTLPTRDGSISYRSNWTDNPTIFKAVLDLLLTWTSPQDYTSISDQNRSSFLRGESLTLSSVGIKKVTFRDDEERKETGSSVWNFVRAPLRRSEPREKIPIRADGHDVIFDNRFSVRLLRSYTSPPSSSVLAANSSSGYPPPPVPNLQQRYFVRALEVADVKYIEENYPRFRDRLKTFRREFPGYLRSGYPVPVIVECRDEVAADGSPSNAATRSLQDGREIVVSIPTLDLHLCAEGRRGTAEHWLTHYLRNNGCDIPIC